MTWRSLRARAGRGLTLVLRGLVFLYQKLVSPLLPAACRYAPSCSAYAAEALRLHGAGAGSLLALGRLCRCHPWAPGGLDPVPLPPLSATQDGAERQTGQSRL